MSSEQILRRIVVRRSCLHQANQYFAAFQHGFVALGNIYTQRFHRRTLSFRGRTHLLLPFVHTYPGTHFHCAGSEAGINFSIISPCLRVLSRLRDPSFRKNLLTSAWIFKQATPTHSTWISKYVVLSSLEITCNCLRMISGHKQLCSMQLCLWFWILLPSIQSCFLL